MTNGAGQSSAKSGLRMIPELRSSNDDSPNDPRNGSSSDEPKCNDDVWPQENERIVLGPYNYMLQHPGKDIRRQLINAFNAWLKVPSESLAIITKVIAMLHTSSLMYVGPQSPGTIGISC
jgi:geranylgeranyl diphosphate synthase type 3